MCGSLKSATTVIALVSTVLALVATVTSLIMSITKYYMARMTCCPMVLPYEKFFKFYDWHYMVPFMLIVIVISILGWTGVAERITFFVCLYSLLMLASCIVLMMFTIYFYLWDDHKPFREALGMYHYNKWKYFIDTRDTYTSGYGDLNLVENHYECCGRYFFEESYTIMKFKYFYMKDRNSVFGPRGCCKGGYTGHEICDSYFIVREGCIGKVDRLYMELVYGARIVYILNALFLLNASFWAMMYTFIYTFEVRGHLGSPPHVVVVHRAR